MKKSALPFLFLALLFVMMNSSFAESTNGWVEVTAGSSPFVYSDELLMVDEHSLDPDVAKMSAALAAAAYSSSTTRSILSQMGFTTIESFYGANFSLTDNDRVYYTIAQKRYGDYTIYCIPIRGTQHAMEWVSNFNMGPTNGYHTGFKAASDDVWNNLMSMINSDGSSSDKRIIWVTGHSRGAAVANIIAGRLTAAGKGHVFGYTFACPNVYYGSAPAYSNIYNFNFANDVVPQVPLTSWGYTRYGRDGTKDISSWASDMMPKAEMDALISALGTLSPGSNESKLVFGLLSWAMIDGDASSLRTLLSDFTDDPDGLVFLITNGYGLGDDTAYFRADYLNMLTFWKENQQTMSQIAAEDWMDYRSSEENVAVFALYDTVAGGTVTSYAQLESLIPTIRERNTAANDLVSVSDIMDVLFDANWSLKGLIKNPFKAHSSGYYTQWMNQDYFGYRGRAGRTYENTEIVINAKTVSPQCFDGATGSFTVDADGVQAIASSAFLNSSGLVGVFQTDELEHIGDHAFRGCIRLTQVLIPDTVEEIGRYTFANCTGLTKVTMPLSMRYNNITYNSSGVNESSFQGCSNVAEIVYTVGNGGVYSGGLPTTARESLHKVTFAEGVTELPEAVLSGCIVVTEVQLPETLTMVSKRAFDGCTSLVTMDVPESVVSIGEYAFNGCVSWQGSFPIWDNTESVGAHAFSECRSLTGSVRIPNGITDINCFAFYGCIGMTELVISDSVENVEQSAFANCTGLAKVTMPLSMRYNNITYNSSGVNESSFQGCSNVAEIVYTVGNGGVYSGGLPTTARESLHKVTFAEGVTELPEAILSGCVAVTEVQLPETLTMVSTEAFSGCNALVEIEIPKSVTAINANAFYHCAKLCDITFLHDSDCSLTISNEAFRVSNLLNTTLYIPDASDVNAAIAEYKWADSNRNVVYVGMTNALLSITLEAEAISANAPITLVVKNLPADTPTDVLIWSVDDESVAQITQEGILTFGRAGYVTVYVALADTDLQAELTVECEGTAIIKLPETLTLVEQEAFMGVAAEIAIIPASVQQIDSRAFSNCPNLYKVVVQNPDTIIADDAFDGSTYATVLVDGEKTE